MNLVKVGSFRVGNYGGNGSNAWYCVFWDNRALKLLRMKVGVNSIPYHFKSLRIILWVFTKLYRPL